MEGFPHSMVLLLPHVSHMFFFARILPSVAVPVLDRVWTSDHSMPTDTAME